MKKFINNFILVLVGTMLLFTSCERENPTLGDPPTLADAEFTYIPSAANQNIIELTANNPDLLMRWDFGNGTEGKSPSGETAIYPNAGTYTITLTVFNKGGSASSTQDIVIAQTDPTLLNNPLYDMLTGGGDGPGFKTWYVDSLTPVHFGVGPDPIGAAGDYPEWWQAPPNEKVGTGMYTDRYTFHLNNFQFDMVTNGLVYIDDNLAADFPGSYPNAGDNSAPYTDRLNENWSLNETDTSITITGDAFIGFYTGIQEYNVVEITDSTLFLQYADVQGGLLWYLRLIPE